MIIMVLVIPCYIYPIMTTMIVTNSYQPIDAGFPNHPKLLMVDT